MIYEEDECTVPSCRTVNFTLPPENSVTVHVEDEAGIPVVDQIVSVYMYNWVQRSSISNTNGDVVFYLPEGSYQIGFEYYGEFIGPEGIDTCDIPSCTNLTIIKPQVGNVDILVLDSEANPVVDQEVFIYSGSEYFRAAGRTNESGVISVSLFTGEYRFGTNYHGRMIYSSTTNDCTIPSCTDSEINLPELYPVTITVENENGLAMSNAAVVPFDGSEELSYLMYTDSNGQAIFYLPPGDYRFKSDIHYFDYFSAEQNHCTVPTCSSIDIETDIFYPVTVTVTDNNSVLQPDVFVGVQDKFYFGWTDTNAQIVFELPTGNHVIYVNQFNRTYFMPEFTVPFSTSINAVIPVTPFIEVTVLDSLDNPVEGANVFAYNGDTEVSYGNLTDSEGIAQVDVPTGDYRFNARITTTNNTYSYFSGETNHCSFPSCTNAMVEVPQFGDVTVTVMDSASVVMADVPVSAYVGGTTLGNSLTTDENGQVTFRLPEGSYRFMAEADGVQAFSGITDHCTITGCETATIQFPESATIFSGQWMAKADTGAKALFSPKFDETTPVTITVLDTANVPQPDLDVTVLSGDSEVGVDGATNSAGQLTVDLPDGNYRVKVDKFGDTYYSSDNNHCEVPLCNAITAVVPVYGLVSVAVNNTSDAAQEGISVVALDGDDQIGDAVFTGANGLAVFNLPEGEYRFRATFHEITYTSGSQNHCTVPNCTDASISVPTYAPVTVTVTDTAGAVQEGLTVTAYQGATATTISGVTDSLGQTVLVLSDGSYRFVTSKMGVERASGAENTCAIPGCSADGITLPTFSQVTVTVVDNNAVPQADVPVFTYSNNQQTGYNGITDANGQVTLTVPQGSYRFRATVYNYNFFSGTTDHCTTPDCSAVTLNVREFAEVTVTVKDTADVPLADTTVLAYRGDEYSGISGQTDANGQVTLNVPVGEYFFRVRVHDVDFNSSPNASCSVPTCSNTQIAVSQFSNVEVTIRDASGNIPDIADAFAYTGNQYTGLHGEMQENGVATVLLPEGEYRFQVRFILPDSAGEFYFFTSDVNNCTVPACTSISITAPALTPVTVSVVDSAGVASAGNFVSAYRVIPAETPEGVATLESTNFHGTSDAAGQVKLYLSDGTYRFGTEIEGMQYYTDPANDLTVPQSVAANLVIPQKGTVEATVSDKDGEVQPNQTVFAYKVVNGVDTYTGYSGVTDSLGKISFPLFEGAYKFLTEQYGLSFWSDAGAVCTVPTCTTALITVLGSTYTATDTTINYTYDDLNRLTAADYSNGMYYHYEYDAAGNRLQQVSAFLADPVTTAYTYDDANRLTTVGGQTYSFDANGNLLSDGTYTYSYDTANRMVGVTTAATAVTYRYNGDGNRLQQSSNGVDTNYTLELNSNLSQVLADGTNTYLYGMNRIGMSNTTGNYLYEYDALGSVRQMENISGLTLAESYDPYGNVILSSGQAGSYGYSGEEQSSSWLVYLRARYMSPGTGNFLSRDTWDGDANSPMSYNRWLYVLGNPINKIDDTGQFDNSPDERITGSHNILLKRTNNPLQYNPASLPPGIDWSPAVSIRSASDLMDNTIKSQYSPRHNGIPFFGGYNLCGQVSVEMILETLHNNPGLLYTIYKYGFRGNRDPTGAYEVGYGAANSSYTYDYFVRSYEYDSLLVYDQHKGKGKKGKPYVTLKQTDLDDDWYGDDHLGQNVLPMIRSRLKIGRAPIVGVVMAAGDGRIITTGEIGHWVVITGLSKQWRKNNEYSEYNWVRINNPFMDREEYYPWKYFKESMEIQNYTMVEIWNKPSRHNMYEE